MAGLLRRGFNVEQESSQPEPSGQPAETLTDADGRIWTVNDQLRTLKAFELMISMLSPAAHRALRSVYNRLGPRLAAALVHPLAADAAYLALKPLEWFARLALRVALGRHVALIARLYRV
jgi:hypothetical protein